MRPLEILLLLLLAFFAIQLITRRRLPALLCVGLPLVAVGVGILHVLIEQTRWQMVPAYLLTAVLALQLAYRAKRDFSISHVFSILLIPLWLVAVALPVVFPVAQLPRPTGPFPVGTIAYQWDDTSRLEAYTADPDDVRQIMVQFWYPAGASATTNMAPFFDRIEVAGPVIARRLGLPSFIFNHTALIRTASIPDAPMVAAPSTFPVLIFSPGYNSLRTQSTTLMEELASHGYVVLALDHTYTGVVTNFPDGRVELLNPTVLPDREKIGEEQYRRKSLAVGDVWEQDTAFVLSRLERGELDSRFAGRLDLNRIGLFGHSTGGGVVSRVCAKDTRCKAGVGLDAWLGVTPDETIAAGSDRPILFLMSESWPSPENNARMQQYRSGSSQVTWLTIHLTQHYDFTDLPFLSPLSTMIGLSGEVDSHRVQEIVRTYTRAFFDQHLKGRNTSMFQQPAADFPEVELEVPSGLPPAQGG
jgi:dienelactone hydrolase